MAHENLNLALNGRNLIKTWEGLRLVGYLCPAGIPTVGYGHTGPEVRVGMRITEQQAEAFLTEDVQWAEEVIERTVDVPLTQNQFDALTSLIFNIGSGNWSSSTARRRLNAGDYEGAAAALQWFNKARVNGVLTTLDGLVARRAEEAALFLNSAIAPLTTQQVEEAQPQPQQVSAEGNEVSPIATSKEVITTIGGAGTAVGVVSGFFEKLAPAAQVALIIALVAGAGVATYFIIRLIKDRKKGIR